MRITPTPETFCKKEKRWLTTTIFFPVSCYNETMLKQDYNNDFFEFGQQKINFSFYELGLPDDDPVYTLKKVMEDLDFSGLLACYSDKGRTGFNPIMLYSVVTYANMRGVRAVDRIVDLCQRDLAFIWLTKGEKPKRDAFYDFKGEKFPRLVFTSKSFGKFSSGRGRQRRSASRTASFVKGFRR